jgi:peptidoglycan/LPS O-acetylase OafA/YrhL
MGVFKDMVSFSPSGKTGYRPEIDGLRALAVVAVILFHYRAPGFGGGFVGVDIFFVISGFLITRILDSEMTAGRFSFGHFYERRIRRIVPALAVLLAVTTAVAAVLLFASDFERYGRTLLATLLFGTNFELWRETGYFDVAAQQKPLLHLWSVAVEEQFYLLFPPFLLMVRHRLRLPLVGLLAVLSFGLAAWGVSQAPAATYFLLPARTWELMTGALLALSGAKLSSRAAREAAGGLGLGLMLWGIFVFTPDTAFPGPNALFPCLGAALFILAGNGGPHLAGRLLSLRPIVFVGLISYSLYLWHWPVLVFARYALFRALTPAESAGLIALCFLLAVLSWRFVEQPFRRSRLRRPRLFGLAAAALALLAFPATAAVALNGIPERVPQHIRRILAEEHDDDGLLQYCFALPLDKLNEKGLCRFGASRDMEPSFILWGDSHADAILLAVEDVAKHEGREGYFAGESSCAPLMGVYRYDTPRCRAFNDRILAFVLAHPHIRTVVLAARWGKNAAGTAYGDEGHGFVPIADDIARARKPADNAAIFARGLHRTLSALRAAGREVVLIGPVPEVGKPVPQVLARMALSGSYRPIGPTLEKYRDREQAVLPLFQHAAATDEGVKAVFPARYLCADGRCRVRQDGIPLYRDGHHLSVYGARLLDPLLAGIFSPDHPGPDSG